MHNSVSVLYMLRFSAGEHLLLHSEPSPTMAVKKKKAATPI